MTFVEVSVMNLICLMILYNVLLYQHIHCGIRLTKLKALDQYILPWNRILWSNSLLNQFLHYSRVGVSLPWQYANYNYLEFQRKFSDFGGGFQSTRLKTQANFYISGKNNNSTSYMHKMSLIRLRPHNAKSFWNYTPKLALQRLLSNLHQRMCFSQWQLPSATETLTNIVFQNLLLLILVPVSRRYSLDV